MRTYIMTDKLQVDSYAIRFFCESFNEFGGAGILAI